MTIRRFYSFFLFLAPTIIFFTHPTFIFANEVDNASFESALGGSNNWDNTVNRGISRVTASDAPSGSSYLRLSEAGIGGIELFTFTFQTSGSEVHPGDTIALNAMVRQNVKDDADDEAQIVIQFNDENSNQIGTAIATTGGTTSATFSRLSVSQAAPSGTTQIVAVLRIQNGEAGGTSSADFDDVNLTINGSPIDLDVNVTKNHVPKGGASFATIGIKNQTAVSQSNLELVLNVPNGLTVLDDGVHLNNQIPRSQEVGSSKFFTIGTIGSADDRRLSFLIVASTGAVIGHRYSITLFVRNSTTGIGLSQIRNIPIDVIADPFFDEGTVIGKVFDDHNENGVQDAGESGISGVQIATEQGILIKTDADGKYHIPGVEPGRHVIKIDGHSLPIGTKFVTEESYLTNVTEGILNQVDFAVKLPESKVSDEYKKDLNVMISRANDFIRPKLTVRMDPEILRIGEGLLEKEPVFKMETNYSQMINTWHLEVKDEQGNEVWTGYGMGAPPAEAPWKGFTKTHQIIPPGIYGYRLIVKDKTGHEDWTPLQFFKAISKKNPAGASEKIEIPAVGFLNIARDGKRSIPTTAKPTLLIRGKTLPGNKVEVNGEPVSVQSDGSFEAQIFTDVGNQPVDVRAIMADGRAVTYRDDVKVKDTEFFMVALGEEELGGNLFRGNFETPGRDDQFQNGFYQKGKAAYYLKGKIKGKFLVTSRYDTSTPNLRNQLFTNLDPDQYYPVYGDKSEISYDAHDTQQRFYLLVEMDRSYLKWGSYQSDFNETELATYNRALSGFKMHYETLETNKYGDSKRGVTVFGAKVKSLADHNEFVGTGGSLYYLRNKNVIQGSEQLTIEIRDKIQGIGISQRKLANGTDYEIDYSAGRILLRKPLSSVAFSDTVLSNEILDGDQVYLMVDYEFEVQDLFGEQPAGVRGYTYLGDHLRIGGTAVKETRANTDYDMRGIDSTLKIGNNTKVSAEYAQSQNAQVRNAVSYNGGISFQPIITGDKNIKKQERLFDGAWSLKAESAPRKGTEISGYTQRFNKGFSNTDSISQKGDIKGGVELKQKLGENLAASYRFDRIENMKQVKQSQVVTQTLQTKYDDNHYLGVLEYRHENYNITPLSTRALDPIFERQEFKGGFGAKLGYHMDNGWLPYLRGQATTSGKPNDQIGAGLEANIDGKGVLQVEQMTGNLGDSTAIGFQRQVNDQTNVYSRMVSGASSDGIHTGNGVSTTIGSSHQLNGNSRFYSERELSSYRDGDKTGNVAGYDVNLDDKWNVGVSGERSRIRDLKSQSDIVNNPLIANGILNVERTAGSVELSYLDKEYIKMINRLELRLDRGEVRRDQYLGSNSIEWKLNHDYTFLSRLNKSISLNREGPGNIDGQFTELNVGLAYRPVAHNKFNFLTRYTWFQDMGVAGQFSTNDIEGLQVDETSQIFGIEGIYDISRYFSFAQKFGYKIGEIRSAASSDWIGLSTLLTVSRINFHVTHQWDLATEYRIRFDEQAVSSVKSGFLFEVDREIVDYVRFGLGYNFTDFGDDLRQSNSYSNHGFFTRISGKF